MNISSFRQKPYEVVYKDLHTGEIKTIKRRPPPLQHEMLPTDIVELKTKKNEDWQEGDEFPIKHISYRAPNMIQLKNEEGLTTFMPSHELELVEEVAYRPGRGNQERDNRYLRWP